MTDTKPKSKAPFKSFVQMNTPQEKKDELMFTDTARKMMSGRWRVWTVALARLNNYGHAPFRTGELAYIVCGSDSPANRAMVARWIKDLGEMGWIAPPGKHLNGSMASTSLCILVHKDMANRGGGKASDFTCSEPSHMDYRKDSWPVAEIDSKPVDVSDWTDTTAEVASTDTEVSTPEPVIDPWEDDGNGANLGRLVKKPRTESTRHRISID